MLKSLVTEWLGCSGRVSAGDTSRVDIDWSSLYRGVWPSSRCNQLYAFVGQVGNLPHRADMADARRRSGETVEVRAHRTNPEPTLYLQVLGGGGADPLVRGRRPRRPARALQDADVVVLAAGRGRPARTGGSALPGNRIRINSKSCYGGP